MGVKIAVVGGGSTYTPELVEGFEARRDRMPIDELVLLDTDPRRLEIVGGLAQRMLDRLDWTGRLRCTGDRDTAIDGADFVLIQLRVGGQAGQARRRDAAADVRRGRPGDHWGRRLRQGAADRAAGAGARRADREARRTRRVDRGFHQPGRDRQPGAARRRAPRDRAVQRRHQHPARDGGAVRGLARAGRARARRAQSPELGARGPDRRRRPSARADRRRCRGARVDGRRPGRSGPGRSARSPRTTCATTTRPDQVVDDQRAGHTRAQEVIDIESQLLDLYQDQGLAEKPALLATRGGAYYSEAAAQLIASLHDGAGDIQVVDVRNDGALPRPARRGRGRDPGAGSTATARIPSPSGRCPRTCSASSRR